VAAPEAAAERGSYKKRKKKKNPWPEGQTDQYMFENINFEEGYILPVDKPLGWTSSDVVRKLQVQLRRIGLRKIKIGHAGTLDPLATGVLLVCIGRATKRVEELQAEEKVYVAEIELGATTPSYDLEHPIDERFPYQHITREAVEKALAAMTGPQEQVPPVYSAKQIGGKRAYEYARQGVEVEMKRAAITIYEMQLLACDLPRVVVSIRCSKGTYIRSIARDLGVELGSGGHLTALRRTRSGNFRADECLALEEIEKSFNELKQKKEKNV
jgi:tRNA pseudouridine55 synthase